MPACFDEATALKRRRRLRPATNHQTNQCLNAAVAAVAARSSSKPAATALRSASARCPLPVASAAAFPSPSAPVSEPFINHSLLLFLLPPANCCPSLGGIPCHNKAQTIVYSLDFPAHPGVSCVVSVRHPGQSGQAKPPSLMPSSPITYRLSCLNLPCPVARLSSHYPPPRLPDRQLYRSLTQRPTSNVRATRKTGRKSQSNRRPNRSWLWLHFRVTAGRPHSLSQITSCPRARPASSPRRPFLLSTVCPGPTSPTRFSSSPDIWLSARTQAILAPY